MLGIADISPENVRIDIVVHITDANYLPILISYRLKQRSADVGVTVHDPDIVGAGGGVLPDNVRLAVVVEIAGTNHFPVSVRNGR